MNKTFASIALALALIAAGCAGKRQSVDFSMHRDRILEDVAHNTRTEKVYRDLDTILVADVFFYDQRIKRDFINAVRGEGRIDQAQADAMLAESAAKEAKEVEFLAGVYTGDKRWNDLEKKDSMWKVALQTADGAWIAPAEITRLKLDKMQDAWLFPFLTEWKFIYRISFPREALAGMQSYTLRFTSVVGEAAFTWDLAAKQ